MIIGTDHYMQPYIIYILAHCLTTVFSSVSTHCFHHRPVFQALTAGTSDSYVELADMYMTQCSGPVFTHAQVYPGVLYYPRVSLGYPKFTKEQAYTKRSAPQDPNIKCSNERYLLGQNTTFEFSG